MDAKQFLEILHTTEQLKNEIRHCTTSNGRLESVAEHSWRLSLMAFLLQDEFPDIDINKVIQMGLIHDLGECFTGDIPCFEKTQEDALEEEIALSTWLSNLPQPLSGKMISLYKEMNELSTKESLLYKSLDKLEAIIQHNESPLSTWEDHEYDLQRNYAQDIVRFSPYLTKLREEILNETEEKIQNESK